MSDVTLTWEGDQFVKDLEQAANKGLTVAAQVGADAAVRGFSKTSGRVVGKTKTGRNKYVAARPGDPPGIRTGNLRNSVASTKGENLRALIGSNIEYGLHLERGTSRMAARPWLKRSVLGARRRMQRAFERRVKAELMRKAG